MSLVTQEKGVAMILTRYCLEQILGNEILAAEPTFDGVFEGAQLMLFKNNINPSVDSLIADLTVPTYTTYAPSTDLVWAAHALSGETNLPFIAGDLKTWTVTTPADPLETMYGFGLFIPGGTPHLLGAELFDVPFVPIAGQTWGIVCRIGLNPIEVSPAGDLVFF